MRESPGFVRFVGRFVPVVRRPSRLCGLHRFPTGILLVSQNLLHLLVALFSLFPLLLDPFLKIAGGHPHPWTEIALAHLRWKISSVTARRTHSVRGRHQVAVFRTTRASFQPCLLLFEIQFIDFLILLVSQLQGLFQTVGLSLGLSFGIGWFDHPAFWALQRIGTFIPPCFLCDKLTQAEANRAGD